MKNSFRALAGNLRIWLFALIGGICFAAFDRFSVIFQYETCSVSRFSKYSFFIEKRLSFSDLMLHNNLLFFFNTIIIFISAFYCNMW